MAIFRLPALVAAFRNLASVVNVARAINVGKHPKREDLERIGIDADIFGAIRMR